MKQLDLNAKITLYRYDELTSSEKILIERAKDSCSKAYAPYSKFHVGAALLLQNGEIVTASNQENAAYPSGLCAERVAIMYANAQYPNVPIVSMAIVAYTDGAYTQPPITPCGACRQVILESERRYQQPIRTLMYGTEEVAVIDSIVQLLPFCFDGELLPQT